jgi:hypothetical protein
MVGFSVSYQLSESTERHAAGEIDYFDSFNEWRITENRQHCLVDEQSVRSPRQIDGYIPERKRTPRFGHAKQPVLSRLQFLKACTPFEVGGRLL